jgi:peptidoglycan/xylan/chitin deacetylase (PgdA/CDA1 family)
MNPDASFYLEERYLRPPRSSRLLPLFYRVKPLIPRRAQMRARRTLARRQRSRHETGGRFPRWPIEPLMVQQRDTLLRERVRRAGSGRVPVLGAWPGGHRFAWTLTHDVEGARGLAAADRLLEIERRYSAVSAWFLVAEDYPIAPEAMDAIRAAGCEIGLHGLHHDGSLFQSRRHFERQLPRIQHHLREWGAVGFRSPSTHRNAAWMPELGAEYDSSFPDTHPFDAQPGGCCSIVPYFLGDMVELPITLPQDHTLFELLREGDIDLWRRKVAYIARCGGLVNVLVHPDYALEPERLAHYDELLSLLRGLEGGWHALPRDVARWWRRRAALERRFADAALDPGEVAAAGGSVWWATERAGAVVIEREVREHA